MADSKDENVKTHLQQIARTVDEQLPEGWGFILLCFPFSNAEGRINYVANCEREDAIRTLKRWLETVEDPKKFGKDV